MLGIIERNNVYSLTFKMRLETEFVPAMEVDEVEDCFTIVNFDVLQGDHKVIKIQVEGMKERRAPRFWSSVKSRNFVK